MKLGNFTLGRVNDTIPEKVCLRICSEKVIFISYFKISNIFIRFPLFFSPSNPSHLLLTISQISLSMNIYTYIQIPKYSCLVHIMLPVCIWSQD